MKIKNYTLGQEVSDVLNRIKLLEEKKILLENDLKKIKKELNEINFKQEVEVLSNAQKYYAKVYSKTNLKKLLESLKNNPYYNSIHIYRINLNESDITSLSQVLKITPSKINFIELGPEKISFKNLKLLLDALKNHEHLNNVYLNVKNMKFDNCLIGKEGKLLSNLVTKFIQESRVKEITILSEYLSYKDELRIKDALNVPKVNKSNSIKNNKI